MNSGNPIVRLLTSSKALVMFAAIAAIVVLAAMHQVTGADAMSFIKVLIVGWMGAAGLEDAGAKAGGALASVSAKPADPAPAPDAPKDEAAK